VVLFFVFLGLVFGVCFFWVWGLVLRFRVWSLRFGVEGVGFRILGLWSMVQGLGSRVEVEDSGFRV
jgi:hypothetical protein